MTYKKQIKSAINVSITGGLEEKNLIFTDKKERISEVHLILNSTILRESLNALIKDDNWEKWHGNAIKILSSLRAEILIKAITHMSGKDYKTTHNLLNLFNSMPNNFRNEVIKRYWLLKDLTMDKKNIKIFMKELKCSKSIFNNIRYEYEFKGLYSNEDMRKKVLKNWKASPRFLLLFSEALQHTYLACDLSNSKNSLKDKFSRQKNMLTNYKN